MKKRFLAISLLLPLAGCVQERSPIWIPSDIAPLFGGGGSAPAPAQPATGYNGQPLAPVPTQLSWTEQAKSTSKDAADSECASRADLYSRETGKNIVPVNVIPAVKGWLCVFEEWPR